MTRETKIGLLVGLAFIIVIGILLSDHLTSSTEPPSAPMSQAGAVVRSAVNTPAPAQSPSGQLSAPVVQVNQPVRTADEFQPRPQPVKIVSVDAPVQQGPVTITSPNTNRDSPESTPESTAVDTSHAGTNVDLLQGQSTNTFGSNTLPPPVQSNDPVVARLNAEAQRVGEAIVPVGQPTAQSPTAMSKYKVESGDTLSTIAQKVYGTSNKTIIAAIIEANPGLKANPNLVIEGRTYNMPTISTGRPVALSSDASARNAPIAQPASFAPKPQSGGKVEPGATYLVEDGDNLTRIAREQCGTEEAVAAIKELNRDLLKGSDVIRPGMKLRLPAKSVAVNQ